MELRMRFAKVKKIGELLPEGVRSFALKEEYWNPQFDLCPHDAWVEEVSIRESMLDPALSREDRTVEISLRLLGWSHEKFLDFTYRKVSRYSVALPERSTVGNRAHGDWLDDWIELSPSGQVVHRVQFSSGAEWVIECADIELVSSVVPEDYFTKER